jgi:hypothetical protein
MSAIRATQLMLVMLVATVTFSWAMGKNLGQPGDKDRLLNELDVSSMLHDATLSLRLGLTRPQLYEYFY